MAYDIYGNNLQRGHCEVHPWVHEEYPCSICCTQSRQDDAIYKERKRQDDELRDMYEREQLLNARDEYCKQWIKYRLLLMLRKITVNWGAKLDKEIESFHNKKCPN